MVRMRNLPSIAEKRVRFNTADLVKAAMCLWVLSALGGILYRLKTVCLHMTEKKSL